MRSGDIRIDLWQLYAAVSKHSGQWEVVMYLSGLTGFTAKGQRLIGMHVQVHPLKLFQQRVLKFGIDLSLGLADIWARFWTGMIHT